MSDLPTREWADRAMLTGLAYDRDQVRDILNAYADGRLIDGQAIADVWNGESMELRIARTGLYEIWPELARGIDLAIGEGLLDALTEEKS